MSRVPVDILRPGREPGQEAGFVDQELAAGWPVCPPLPDRPLVHLPLAGSGDGCGFFRREPPAHGGRRLSGRWHRQPERQLDASALERSGHLDQVREAGIVHELGQVDHRRPPSVTPE
jgi:hypothetical protein